MVLIPVAGLVGREPNLGAGMPPSHGHKPLALLCLPDGKRLSPCFDSVGASHRASRRAGTCCSSILLRLFLVVVLQPPSHVAQLFPQSPKILIFAITETSCLLASSWEVPITCTSAASPALRKFYGFRRMLDSFCGWNRVAQMMLPYRHEQFGRPSL